MDESCEAAVFGTLATARRGPGPPLFHDIHRLGIGTMGQSGPVGTDYSQLRFHFCTRTFTLPPYRRPGFDQCYGHIAGLLVHPARLYPFLSQYAIYLIPGPRMQRHRCVFPKSA